MNVYKEQIMAAATGPSGGLWLERPGRGLAAAGFLWPKFIDRRLIRFRDQGVREKKRRWRLLQTESAIACNLRCVMCPWKEISRRAQNRGLMSQKVWEAIQPHLKDVTSIDFTGGGEPLLQPRLAEWIADAKDSGCETGFLSNGLLLRERKLKEILEAGVDWICISMDGATADMYNRIRAGSNFDRVCENVANIAKFRARKIPKSMINFVLMDINSQQMEEIIRLAARLEVDQVNFKQCDVIRGEHGKGFGLYAAEETTEIRQLKKGLAKAERLAKKFNVKTTSFAFTPEELPVCEQDPRNSLFIRYDGRAAPCINLAIGGPTTFLGKDVTMPTVHYGRLPEGRVEALWETATCRFYRERFQERVQKHDEMMVSRLMNSSGSGRDRAMREAREAMPDPPEGCEICHYLYDI